MYSKVRVVQECVEAVAVLDIRMKHLKDKNLTYFQHLRVAWILAFQLLLLSLTSLVHGMLPFIFSSSTSNGLKKLNEELP